MSYPEIMADFSTLTPNDALVSNHCFYLLFFKNLQFSTLQGTHSKKACL